MPVEIVARLRCPFCWGPFEARTLQGVLFDLDSYGTLGCDCGEFPVVNGIPVLDRRHNEQRLVTLIRRRSWTQATSECLMVDVEASRLMRLFQRALRKLDLSNRLATRVRAHATCRGALRIAYPTSGVYHEYLRCRFSDPTFVAGEWLVKQTTPTDGWILDVPAGVGHFTWALRRHHPQARLVAADASFFNLFMLKKYVMPLAAAICLDGNTRLPFEAGQFDLALSADGWQYVDAQAQFLHELARVTDARGPVLILHVHNQGAANPTPGRPMSYAELQRWLGEIADGRPSDILDERAFVDRAWAPAATDSPFDYPAAPHAPVFDIWLGKRPAAASTSAADPTSLDVARDGSRDAARDEGKWIVNPLYVPDGGTKFARRFMNPNYAQEFSELAALLPAEIDLGGASADQLAADPTLVAKRVILFVPKGY